LKAFEGYTNIIHSVAFNSDGKTLVSCSDDQKIRLWDVEQGECLQQIDDQNSQIRSVIFSPNGEILASCGLDSKIKLWYRDPNDNFSVDKLREISQKHTSWASSIAFSPDGKMLASGGADFYLHLWEIDIHDPDNNYYPKLSDIKPAREDLGNSRNHWIRSVSFSPDGNRIAIASADKTITLWIWNDQEHKYKFETNLNGHSDQVISIAFSPNSQILASGSADKTVRIWDIATVKCLYELDKHQGRVLSVAVSSNGIVASGSDDKTVRLWNISTGEQIMDPLNHEDWVRSVAFSTQSILASGGEDGTIKLWNPDTGRLLKTLRIPKPYEGLNITGVSGLTDAQKEALKALGAIEDNSKPNITPETQSQKKDFFISYNNADKNWAEWIAWTLEEAGYSVVIQAWDFRPGGNFILDMQRATEDTERTIAVLSEEYLKATYTQPEWAAAFRLDPQSIKRIMIPIRVQECKPTGLLGPIVYIDLVGLSQAFARNAILEALKERAKPIQAPAFPGSRDRVTSSKVQFPG
jgi:WD40 repeat protein